ncbi:ATP-binding protein [Novosphingobium tardum]|uniref:histidine kinase n=1 Tax=Novosphingobium tardum TaxID=1538021 RepID=A0ABV8RK91_9SPHN
MPNRLRALVHSTTARLVLLLFLCQVVATAGALAFVRSESERAINREQRALVGELRDELVAAYDSGGRERLSEAIDERLDFTFGRTAVILLRAPDGAILAGNLDAWPAKIGNSTAWQVLTVRRSGSSAAERMGFTATALGDGSHLLAGHVIEGSVRLNDIDRNAMLAAMALAVPLALFLAVILGRMIDRRISRIARTVAAVGNGALSQRVPSEASGDAFDRLAQGINAMLARIEALIGELRTVTDGLAHDLRSPVTRLTSIIERAALETRDPTALAALEHAAREADSLLGMLTMALQISRAEAGIGRELFAPCDISALLGDVVEVYGPLAEDRGFALSARSTAVGDFPLHRPLVSQALGNLVDNALNYATGGTRIVLSAEQRADGLVLIVDDNGIGVAPERRAEALARFGRLDPARHLPGSGLGLALVEAVARLHGGEVVLGDNAPGLRVTMRLARDG